MWKAIYKHEKMEILVVGKGENLYIQADALNEGNKEIEFKVSGLNQELIKNFDVAD